MSLSIAQLSSLDNPLGERRVKNEMALQASLSSPSPNFLRAVSACLTAAAYETAVAAAAPK